MNARERGRLSGIEGDVRYFGQMTNAMRMSVNMMNSDKK